MISYKRFSNCEMFTIKLYTSQRRDGIQGYFFKSKNVQYSYFDEKGRLHSDKPFRINRLEKFKNDII